MMPIDALPDDLDALRALVSCLSIERDAAIEECRRVREQNDRLHHLLRQLQRAQFGRRSERLDHEQMQLASEDIETTIAEQDATIGMGSFASSTTAASNSTPTSWKEVASASLLRRRAHKARQSLACIAPRRAHGLGLGSTAFRRSPRGVITRATRVRAQSNEKIKPSEQCDRKIAYEECLGWARTALTDRERDIFLQIARAWNEAAEKLDGKDEIGSDSPEARDNT